MSLKVREKSTKLLEQQYKHVKGKQKQEIDTLIELYRMGNIHNINTARYANNKLLTPTTKPQQKLLDYLKTIVKYMEPSKHQQNKTNKAKTIQSQRKKGIKTWFPKLKRKLHQNLKQKII